MRRRAEEPCLNHIHGSSNSVICKRVALCSQSSNFAEKQQFEKKKLSAFNIVPNHANGSTRSNSSDDISILGASVVKDIKETISTRAFHKSSD